MRSTQIYEKGRGQYDVLIADKFDALLPALIKTVSGKKAFIITDDHVASLHLSKLTEALCSRGVSIAHFVLPAGEQSKTMAYLTRILEALLENSFGRKDIIINLGGGVVTDLGGFAASVYMRGIDYLNIPTTLLGMIDSSVGGKTGLDLGGVKNAVGAFCSPTIVLEALEFLPSLSETDVRSGLGEFIKYNMISGLPLLDNYRASGSFTEDDICACCEIKKDYVEADLFDLGMRKILNLGHTYGHAFEAASEFSLLHGEAVALGLVAETEFGEHLGCVPAGFSDEVRKTVESFGLDTDYSKYAAKAARFISHDKKNSGSIIEMPFCSDFGKPFLREVDVSEAADFLAKD